MKCVNLSFIIFVLLIASCRNQVLDHLEGTYTIDYIEFEGENITDSAYNHRFDLYFEGYVSPMVPEIKGFGRTSLAAFNSVEISPHEELGEYYIKVEKAGLLSDTYRVRCQDVDCCKVVLRNSEKTKVISMLLAEPSERNNSFTCDDYNSDTYVF